MGDSGIGSGFAFTATRLDRRADRRDDPEFLSAALADPMTRIVVFCNDECLVDGPEIRAPRYLSVTELAELGVVPWPPIFLGIEAGNALFAIDIDAAQRERIARPHFAELWRNAERLPDHEATTLAYAKGMLEWHRRHRYCGRSGALNAVVRGGHQLIGAEENAQFPRVDPAIIVLVQRDDRCLLGRKPAWPEDWYTTIAGFVEPGERLEDAVRREVKEETNIEVEDVEYVASQPWPFPTSLMIGFHATAAPGPIVLNDKELADADWFSREDIASRKVRIPPAMSIASHLIERWYDRGVGPSLKDVIPARRWR